MWTNPTTRGRRWTGRSDADLELEGECDRCEKWVRRRSLGGLCSGCCKAERDIEPVRVQSDEHPTPGLHVPKDEVWTPISAGMRRLREEHRRAELERKAKP